MELKVSVDNSVRLVCGLNSATTVQEVIFAIANSIKQTGRFYLIEKLTNIQKSTKPILINEQSDAFYLRKKFQTYSNVSNVNCRAPRIMSPNEKLIDILNRISNKNELIEFHLFRSKYSTSNDEQTERLIETELLNKIKALAANTNDFILPTEQPLQQPKKTNESFFLTPPETVSQQSASNSSLGSLSSEAITYSNTESSATDSLFKSIHTQQLTLEEQSVKLDDLFKIIESYEIANLHLSKENETFKTKLSNLEAINTINANKLTELERETNEESLNKEIEMNEYLCAQRTYYERKLNELQISIDNKKQEASSLTNQLNQLNKELEEEQLQQRQQELVSNDLLESVKQSELNTARLDYLQLSSNNMDHCLKEKYKLIEFLESEFVINETSPPEAKFDFKLEENSSVDSVESNVSTSSLSSSCSSVGGGDLSGRFEISQFNKPNGKILENRKKLRLLKQANLKAHKFNKFENIHYF